MNADWRNRHDAAVNAAQQAGAFALQYFDQDIAVEVERLNVVDSDQCRRQVA